MASSGPCGHAPHDGERVAAPRRRLEVHDLVESLPGGRRRERAHVDRALDLQHHVAPGQEAGLVARARRPASRRPREAGRPCGRGSPARSALDRSRTTGWAATTPATAASIVAGTSSRAVRRPPTNASGIVSTAELMPRSRSPRGRARPAGAAPACRCRSRAARPRSVDAGGHLVAGDALGAERPQLVRGRASRPSRGTTKATTTSASRSSGTPTTARRARPGACARNSSTSRGRHVDPARLDHLGRPRAEVQRAVLVEGAQVAGAVPAVRTERRRSLPTRRRGSRAPGSPPTSISPTRPGRAARRVC